MKLGLITDVHEHVSHLQSALATFRREGVDQIVMIGDVFHGGDHFEETCALLTEANANGVWGNHDHWVSNKSPEDNRERWGSTIVDYMTSLHPSLEVDGCFFAHIEPWLDPTRMEDLWHFEGTLDEHGKLARIFDAVPNRLMFMGHYHRWVLARPDGIVDWKGDSPIRLDDDRYFVVVGALCDGDFATFDTATSELVPFHAD
jgi:hypothetical protein